MLGTDALVRGHYGFSDEEWRTCRLALAALREWIEYRLATTSPTGHRLRGLGHLDSPPCADDVILELQPESTWQRRTQMLQAVWAMATNRKYNLGMAGTRVTERGRKGGNGKG